ncbi:MAG TPA: ADOP family duplicated permease [Gemmatimonadaceae bacterium]|nr:ADOP family duplicated permease [Gemmatimonadaceae bacterium]
MHTAQLAKDVASDSAFALRSFRRAPGWAFVTLLTIALGVGASTAVFSVADTFLIQPLPYRDASRVYAVSLEDTVQGRTYRRPVPPHITREWRRSARTIEDAASYGPTTRSFFHGALNDVYVRTTTVDEGFLGFTGARPVIGRGFTPDETVPNGPRSLLISEGFWRREFGGSPDVLGKAVRLAQWSDSDSRSWTVVGVMPASLALPDFQNQRPDIWLPLVDREESWISGVAVRLRPGQSPRAASEELTAILDRTGGLDQYGSLHPRVRVSRPQDDLTFRQALLLLTGAVVLLLLIACSNVSHLLLQRGLTRERELAIREALGAGRLRLVRQLVTESTLLALAGGALAMVVAWASLNGLMWLRPTDVPALSYVSTTRGVVPIAAALAIAVGLAIGVLGAMHVVHGHLGQSLRAGASSATRSHRRLRATLVVGQIGLSAILLVGAILLIRAVVDLERERLGFDPRDLYAVSFDELKHPRSLESQATFAATIREAARRTLGTRDVTIAADPFSAMGYSFAVEMPEHRGAVWPAMSIKENSVAPDYFSMLRMPLIAGRLFDDGALSSNEVIVSRSLAHRLWHDDNVIGRQFRNATPGGGIQQWQTVVGVAPDILTNRLDRESKPVLYRSFPHDEPLTSLIVRLRRKDALELLRRFAKSVQPDPLEWGVRDVNEEVEQSTAEPRFTMAVLLLFALCGVLLAAIGLFGVVSYTLSQRTREIGVRITLGATRRDIVGLLLRDALSEVALGTGIGLVGALAVTRFTQTLAYGVHGFEPITFILAAVAVLLASSVACAGPLFRATRVDPTVAIRGE